MAVRDGFSLPEPYRWRSRRARNADTPGVVAAGRRPRERGECAEVGYPRVELTEVALDIGRASCSYEPASPPVDDRLDAPLLCRAGASPPVTCGQPARKSTRSIWPSCIDRPCGPGVQIAGYGRGVSGFSVRVMCALLTSTIAPERAICAGFSAAIAAGSRCAFKAALSDSVCGSDEGWDAHPGHLVCQGR